MMLSDWKIPMDEIEDETNWYTRRGRPACANGCALDHRVWWRRRCPQ